MNRNKSRSISLIEVDLSNPSKHYDVNNEDVISEHKANTSASLNLKNIEN